MVKFGFSNYTHGQPHTPVFQEQELKLVELNHNVNSAKSKVRYWRLRQYSIPCFL